jgi:hypothetical protein
VTRSAVDDVPEVSVPGDLLAVMWQHDTGMLRPYSANRSEIVTDCMIELLAEGGSAAVTLRTLADRAGVTPSGVL